MAIPDNLRAIDVKLVLERLNYRLHRSTETAWHFSDGGGGIPIALQKTPGVLRPSYVAMVLGDLGVKERDFLAAHAAITAAATASAPPSSQSSSASPPSTS